MHFFFKSPNVYKCGLLKTSIIQYRNDSHFDYRYFNNPVPSMEILQENFDLLRTGIIEGLKSKITSQTLAINCRHDVFKYIFKGKGINAVEKNWQLFEKADFDKCRFPQDWDIVLDGSGDGSKIKFPVKMRCFLSWSQKYYTVKDKDLVEAPRSFKSSNYHTQ